MGRLILLYIILPFILGFSFCSMIFIFGYSIITVLEFVVMKQHGHLFFIVSSIWIIGVIVGACMGFYEREKV